MVIDLINSDNGTSFAYNELVLSPPTENNITNNNRNTMVGVTSSDAFQFSGEENMYYNRLDFGILFTGLNITLGGAGMTDISGLLPELNATFGLGLTMADLVAQNFPANPTYPLNLTIVANANSYAYIGQFNVTVQNTAPQIGDNLTTTVLGNIGSDAFTLQTAVLDINTLSASMIKMNLERYKKNNFLRALAEDVKNNAMSDIRQALDIANLYDITRSLRADLTSTQALDNLAGVNAQLTALQTQLATLQTGQANLTTQINGLQTQITTNQSAIHTMQGQITGLQNTVGANSTAITGLNSSVTTLQTQMTAAQTTQGSHTTEINTLQSQVAALQAQPTSSINAGSVKITTTAVSQFTGTISIGKLALLTQMQTDVPCRVRLYSNTGGRDADLARNATTAVSPGIGQLFEGITTPTLLSFFTGPAPFLYNGDSPTDDMIAYTIEPTVAGVANVTLNFYSLLT